MSRKFVLTIEYDIDDPDVTVQSEFDEWTVDAQMQIGDVIGSGGNYKITGVITENGVTVGHINSIGQISLVR